MADGEHLFIADNPQQFTEKTVELLTNETLRWSMADRARERVLKHYDWDLVAERLLKVFAGMTKCTQIITRYGKKA